MSTTERICPHCTRKFASNSTLNRHIQGNFCPKRPLKELKLTRKDTTVNKKSFEEVIEDIKNGVNEGPFRMISQAQYELLMDELKHFYQALDEFHILLDNRPPPTVNNYTINHTIQVPKQTYTPRKLKLNLPKRD